MSVTEKFHKTVNGPHWYLAAVGSRDEHQGRGLGSELVEVGTSRADEAGLPCYLETGTQSNIDFYAGVLGLRLVKITVNFDDPRKYHLYYGDGQGHPGTILTFFPWPGAFQGRIGTGQLTVTSFAVPEKSLPYWRDHLQKLNPSSWRQIKPFRNCILASITLCTFRPVLENVYQASQ